MVLQVGSYVPCDQADFLVFDQIRTRMGADDDIANGILDSTCQIARFVCFLT